MKSITVTQLPTQEAKRAAEVHKMEVEMDIEKITLEMGTFPVELLEKIFMSMTIGDLLRSRLVSQKWKNISTRVCRQRYVTLKSEWQFNANGTEILKQTYKNRESIPWSSCSDLPTTNMAKLSTWRPNMLKFIKHFGWNLLEWNVPERLASHFVGLCKLLKLTPNLRQLELPQYENNPQLLMNVGKLTCDTMSPLSLRFLKFLQMAINDQTIILLKLLLRSAPGLQYLETSIDFSEDKVSESRELVTIFGTISALSLDVEYVRLNLIKALLVSKLGIDELILRIDDPSTGSNSGFYDLAEEFLRLNSENLKSLTLFSQSTTKFLNIPIKVSCFKSLHTLKLQFYVIPRMYAPPSGAELYHKFTAFKNNQFPVLQKVVIHAEGLRSPTTIFTRPGIESPNTQYDSVIELDVSSSFVHEEWAKIFPNLKRYSASLGDEGVIYLLANLQQLEVMDLLLTLSGDANALLSGIDEPETVYQQPAETILERRRASGRPSLLDFKNLRRLELTLEVVWNKKLVFRDCGAYLSVLEMKPLEYLSIVNAKISEACSVKLKQHHQEFTTNIE